jgi:predicted alpha-1,2-mannosidase
MDPGIVDVFAGTGGSRPWFSGNTHPGATLPFGLVRLGPSTSGDAAGAASGAASGYAAEDGWVRGFSPLHLSGAGCRAFGDVPVLPVTGRLPAEPGASAVPLVKGGERAGPGWYAATLGNAVRVRLAASHRTGLMSVAFPAARRALLLVKGDGALTGADRVRLRGADRRTLAVSATSGGFCGAPNRYRVHVVLRFDRPVARAGTVGRTRWLSFGRNAGTVTAQIGVSFVSPAGAARNLARERPGWSVSRLRTRATAAWDRSLAAVRVAGGTYAERRLLASALYRALSAPMTVSDADRRYPGFDGWVHRVPRGRQYSAIAGWDAYRGHTQLLAWLRPDVASDVVASLLRAADQGGWMPRWPLVSGYTGVMNGDSAAPLAAGAYAFGARGFDLDGVVRALVRQAETTRGRAGQGWFRPRPELADYLRLGYSPNAAPERGWSQPHGGSRTLEYAVDDFAVSRMAAAAGRPAVATRLLVRSGSWQRLLDPARQLLVPRDAQGAFAGAGYDPASCCDGFQEGNAVQYTFGGVPHDMAGLLSGLGGREEVLARLDAFHERLNAGAGSPYAWLGNQPTAGTPWAYLWLGAPARSQDVVARARGLWSTGPAGVPGNDDLGALSAAYVWASLGLWPLIPGTSVVGIGTPAFSQATVTSSSGIVTRVLRRGSAPHVRSVRVDGRPWTDTWVPFGPAARPRTLVITTTADPAPGWGTAPAAAPPSYAAR